MAHHVNRVLKAFFKELNIKLVDFKLEFGPPARQHAGAGGRNLLTPAASGTPPPTLTWTRTCSAGIWAEKWKRTRK